MNTYQTDLCAGLGAPRDAEQIEFAQKLVAQAKADGLSHAAADLSGHRLLEGSVIQNTRP